MTSAALLIATAADNAEDMTGHPSTLTWHPPAKINLHLRVGPARADGFHPLLTWMTTVGLYDRLTATRTGGTEVSMTCDDPSLPVDGTNLVVRAARALGVTGVRLHLEKSIPHGGGLGGGSSDAASVLVRLNELFELGHGTDRLAELAGMLGSDVPFFLFGPSSICRGRGEIVRPVPKPARARWALLILPGIPVPTPAVYRQFDQMKLGADVEAEPDWAALAQMPAEFLLHELVNDLEPPAFALRPELGRLRQECEDAIGRTVRMSGSGSTLFSLFDQETDAADLRLTVPSRLVRLAPPF
jgi:4-diphosphocytidyl-2-C-methyl-D-erythritol kinase